MEKLKDYLLSVGFKTTSNNNDFYTVLSKDGRNILFGLSEHKKPPTVIGPRPKIQMKRTLMHHGNRRPVEIICEKYDDAMNHVLANESMEDIHNAMFDKSIVFRYTL